MEQLEHDVRLGVKQLVLMVIGNGFEYWTQAQQPACWLVGRLPQPSFVVSIYVFSKTNLAADQK